VDDFYRALKPGRSCRYHAWYVPRITVASYTTIDCREQRCQRKGVSAGICGITSSRQRRNIVTLIIG